MGSFTCSLRYYRCGTKHCGCTLKQHADGTVKKPKRYQHASVCHEQDIDDEIALRQALKDAMQDKWQKPANCYDEVAGR